MWDALQPWWPNGAMRGLHWLVSFTCKVIFIFNLFHVCSVVLFYVSVSVPFSGLWYVLFCRYPAPSWWKFQFFYSCFISFHLVSFEENKYFKFVLTMQASFFLVYDSSLNLDCSFFQWQNSLCVWLFYVLVICCSGFFILAVAYFASV